MIGLQHGAGRSALWVMIVAWALACTLDQVRGQETPGAGSPPAESPDGEATDAPAQDDDGATSGESRLHEFFQALEDYSDPRESNAAAPSAFSDLPAPPTETAQLPGQRQSLEGAPPSAGATGSAPSEWSRSLNRLNALFADLDFSKGTRMLDGEPQGPDGGNIRLASRLEDGNGYPGNGQRAAWPQIPDDDTSVSIDGGMAEPEFVDPQYGPGPYGDGGYSSPGWGWTLLPEGLIYKSYLAGRKESRFASVWAREEDFGPVWDVALGGRVGLFRWGSCDQCDVQGWQLDLEGAAFPRLDMNDGRRELVAADFRVGFPLTHGEGPWQFKYAYYHLSSHLGDEYILRTGAMRINYVRDSLVYGVSYYARPDLRLYGEAGYAFHYDGGARPWEFQFGIDWAPACPTGLHGAPFAAVNWHLRQDFDFGGALNVQAGWSWRGGAGRLIRTGFQYYNGKSPQYVFFDQDEEQLAFGIWYDY